MGEKWRIRASRRLRRWKRRMFEPLTLLEKEAQDDIKLLETIADWENEFNPPRPEDDYEFEEDPTKYLEIDTAPIFERLQKKTPILIYASGRRLERLTRWLILWTIVLAILTIVTLIVDGHIFG